MSDKKFRNAGEIILEEDEKTISESCKVSDFFNDFFISVASEIGFEEDIVSVADAINEYNTHTSIEKIKQYQIAKFMGPTWGPPGSCRTQMGPMNLAIRDTIKMI